MTNRVASLDLPDFQRITVSEYQKNQLEERLSTARSQRIDAQKALNSKANEALKEAKELCADLADERFLAQQIMADAE